MVKGVKIMNKSSHSSSSTNNAMLKLGNCCDSVLDPVSGKTVLQCRYPECLYKTDKNSNFKRHLETMHRLLQPAISCCEIIFVTKGEYRFHTRTVHRDGHECNICSKKFNRKALLERHKSIHTGNKPFVCPFCEYASANKANVIRHLATHGSSDEVLCAVADLQSQSGSGAGSPPALAQGNATSSAPSRSASSSSSTCTAPSPVSQDGGYTSGESKKEEGIPPFPLSHSIESILSSKKCSNNDSWTFHPETVLPQVAENHTKTNDTEEPKSNQNWSQLSSHGGEGLAMQLHEYNNFLLAQAHGFQVQQMQHQHQFPLHYNYELNPQHGFYNNNQDYYYGRNMRVTEAVGGGFEETRRNNTDPKFLSMGCKTMNAENETPRGIFGMNGPPPPPQPTLFLNENTKAKNIHYVDDNNGDDDDAFYTHKKHNYKKLKQSAQ